MVRPVAHGHRATYINQKCRCLLCRVANAAYIAARRKGESIAGFNRLVSAHKMHIMMRALRSEMSNADFCKRVGWWPSDYGKFQRATRVRLRTALKVRRVYMEMTTVGEVEELDSARKTLAKAVLEGLGRS